MSEPNIVILMGNLTNDPVLSRTRSGVAVCNFRMAHNKKYKQNGEEKEQSVFINVRQFGLGAEATYEYCKKGGKILIEGELILNEWETDHGDKKSYVEILARFIKFLNFTEKPGG